MLSSSSSFRSVLIVAVLMCMLHVALAVGRTGNVLLYSNSIVQQQLNIYLGDQFLLSTTPEGGLPDIGHLDVTQSIQDMPSAGQVTVMLQRVEKRLFKVTGVSPVNAACGGDATTLARTYGWPFTYVTQISARDGQNRSLAHSSVSRIMLHSHRVATNPGILVDIYPNV